MFFMFVKLRKSLGIPDSPVQSAVPPVQSPTLDIIRIKHAARLCQDSLASKYREALPSNAKLHERAQVFAEDIIRSIPNRLENDALQHGWDFINIQLIPSLALAQNDPAEHQARILAVPLITKWCSDNKLNTSVLAIPSHRAGDHEILILDIRVRF